MTDKQKLLQFAKLIGITVVNEKPGKADDGYFIYDSELPTISMKFSKKGSTSDALVLLHELGHALDWIEMGRPGPEQIPEAFEKAKTKADRRILYEYEVRAIRKMKFIYELLSLELPAWRLERERRYDEWMARRYLEDGKYPNRKQYLLHRKLLTAELKNQNMFRWSLI